MAEEEEDTIDPNAWALPFGDMIMLLMTFFILIISMSTLKMEDIVEEINKNLGLGDNLMRAEIRETGLFNEDVMSRTKVLIEKDALAPPVDDLERIRDEMVIFVTENRLAKVVNLERTRAGFSISIKTDIIFDPGKAEIKLEYLFLLDSIAGLASAVSNDIRVEGHTDNRISDYVDSYNLSIARATSVCQYLIDEEMLEHKRFSVAGYGGTRPLYPNTSEENQAKNRRVEILIRQIQ